MRTLLPSLLCCALVAACHDGSPPTAPLERPTPDAPRLALITTGITDLGTVGADAAFASAINDFGQVVGSAVYANSINAFLWANGATTVFSGAGSSASAKGINNLGQIVGSSGSTAVVWLNGTEVLLGGLPSGGFSEATAINELGQIVGEGLDAASKGRAIQWVNGVATDLGTLGGDASGARDINEVGQIVGTAVDGAGRSRPALWVNGTPTDLGTLGGATGNAAAINDLGQIVGRSETGTPGVFHATLWQNGTATDLGTSSLPSSASDINQLGQIVGSRTDQFGVSHAVLWMDGSVYDLGDLPGTTNGSDAVSINDLGEVVGYASNIVRWQVALRAAIDAVPGDATNAIKTAGGGTVSVTVLGSRWFDAAQIDARTVTVGNEDGTDTPVTRKKNGQPTATLRDVNRDGYADLALEFDKKQMTNNGDLGVSTTQLVLLGTRLDGRRVRGVDKVTVQ